MDTLWLNMKTFFGPLLCFLVAAQAFAQTPPYVKNPFTTNSPAGTTNQVTEIVQPMLGPYATTNFVIQQVSSLGLHLYSSSVTNNGTLSGRTNKWQGWSTPLLTVSSNVIANMVPNAYIRHVVSTQAFTRLESGPLDIEVYFSESGAGTVTLHPEVYLYDTVAGTLAEIGSGVPQTVSGTTPTLFSWSISITSTNLTNPNALVWAWKVDSSGAAVNLVFWQGSQFDSHVSFVQNVGNLVINGSQIEGYPVAVLASQLPTPAVGQYPFYYVTDAITSEGIGSVASWNGTLWRTIEGVTVTTDVKQFILNAWGATLNKQTSLSSVWFCKEPLYAGSIITEVPLGSIVTGSGNVSLQADSTIGTTFALTLTGNGGVVMHSINHAMSAGHHFGMLMRTRVFALSTVGQSYFATFGTGSNNTTNYPTSGAFFLYDHENVTAHGVAAVANWIAVTCQASTYTFSDTGFPVPAGGSYAELGLILTSTNCLFYTNGVLAATHTTNIPTTAQYLYRGSIVRHEGSGHSLYVAHPALHLRQATVTTY